MRRDPCELSVISLLFECCLWVEVCLELSLFVHSDFHLPSASTSSLPPAVGRPQLSLGHPALPTPVGVHMVTLRGSV